MATGIMRRRQKPVPAQSVARSRQHSLQAEPVGLNLPGAGAFLELSWISGADLELSWGWALSIGAESVSPAELNPGEQRHE